MALDNSSTIDDNANTNTSTDISTVSVAFEEQAVFYIFLFLNVLSVLCSLLLLYYFFRVSEFRQQHYSNQMVIYLLIGTFLVTAVDVPLILPYFQHYYYIASMKYPELFCAFWIMYEYITFPVNLWLIALLSLERYLLIFFKQIVMKNRKRRFFLYYAPVTLIVLFLFFWSLYLVALYPCAQTQFDFTQLTCGFPCYQTFGSEILLNFDWAITSLLPVFITVFFTLLLIFHVLYQRHKVSKHLTHRDTWRRTRKMFLQLLPITAMFLLFIMPLIIVGLLAISDPWYNTTPYFYVNILSYCLPFSIPFAILSKQRPVQRWLLAAIRPTRFTRIGPVIIIGPPARLVNNQAI